MFLFVFYLFSFVHVLYAFRLDSVAYTQVGQVRGQFVHKFGKINVKQFLSVPYAAPPIHERRFQKPFPLDYDPTRIIDATQFAPTCIQHRHLQEVVNPLLNVDLEHKTSEDCLYLSIYVPVINESYSFPFALPVMVWFAGEGFDFADARQFDGSYLASFGQVIVVSVQYRVGVFGFLHDESLAPGNMGLWDQLEALKWIKKNIAAFGGNANSITIFGRFSGSMSISYLLASPLLRYGQNLPLFNRAILMSGVAVGEWALETKHYKKASQFIHSLGCDKHNASKCLLEQSPSQILSKAGYDWRPSLDLVLIEDEPLKVISKGGFAKDVNQVIIGSTESDGSLCLLQWFAAKSSFYYKMITNKITNREIFQMVKSDIKTYQTGNQKKSFQKISKYLFSSNKKASLRQHYIDFCSSLLIHSNNEKLSKILSENYNIDTYTYRLKYKPSFSIAPRFIKTGAHGDDVLLAFGLINSYAFDNTSTDHFVSHYFIKLLSSFAWNGTLYVLNLQYDPESAKMKKNKKMLMVPNGKWNSSLNCDGNENLESLFNVITVNNHRLWRPSDSNFIS